MRRIIFPLRLPALIAAYGCSCIGLVYASGSLLTHQRDIQAHKSHVACLEFSPDSKCVASGGGSDASWGGYGEVKLFQSTSGELVRRLADYEITVRALAYSSDGKTIAAGGFPVAIWELPSGRRVKTIKPSASLISLAYLPDKGQLVTLSRGESNAIVWNIQSGKQVAVLDAAVAGVSGQTAMLELSSNRALLATGGWETCPVIWACTDWSIKSVLKTNQAPLDVEVVRFSVDGEYLFTSGDYASCGQIWEVKNSRVKCVLGQDDFVLTDAAFTTDGRLLVTVGYRGMRIWDVETGKMLEKLNGNFSSVDASPDGKMLAVGSNHGVISLYRIATIKEK